MINEKIGNNIKKWRKLKKLTQQELGLLIDKNVKSIQRYETGVNPIPVNVLSNIAKALNISIEYLISGIEENIKEKALKTFDIEELLKRQAMLDKKFDEKKTPRKRDKNKIYIAYFAELGELLQELKSEWNYWKNGTDKPDKQKVLEEMSDCLHFLLSFFNQDEFWKRGSLSPQEYKEDIGSFENALIYLSFLETTPVLKIFGAMLIVAGHVGATEEEFLQVHHEKWLKNMNERVKE